MKKNYKLIMFDLDKTLARSKSNLDQEMIELLSKLNQKYKIAIISGGDYPQFQKQVINYLPDSFDLNNLHLLPTSGAKYYKYNVDSKSWDKIYADEFNKEEKELIIKELDKISKIIDATEIFGKQIEDRGTQITFSALGQQAPVEIKEAWDRDGSKKNKLKFELDKVLNEFEVKTGGSTSIDVTKKGFDKGVGAKKFLDLIKLNLLNVLFIGDAIYEGGNDFPIKELGIDTWQTSNPNETKDFIRKLL